MGIIRASCALNFLRFVAPATMMAAQLFAQTPAPATYTPLTGEQRWHHYWHQTFLEGPIYFASLGAAVGGQLSNAPPEWGQGVEGYSKRVGNYFATYVIQASVHEASSAALGYDPRYLQCDCTGFKRRLGHAILWSFLTKNTSGQTRVNLPVFAGAYAGGMIHYLWYPDRYSPWKDGFRDGSQQVGFSVGVSILKEFSPEIRRVLHIKIRP